MVNTAGFKPAIPTFLHPRLDQNDSSHKLSDLKDIILYQSNWEMTLLEDVLFGNSYNWLHAVWRKPLFVHQRHVI